MKHIKLYQTEDAFVAEKDSLLKPWVTLTKDDNVTHYSFEKPHGLKFTALEDMKLSMVQKFYGPGGPEASQIPFVNIIVTDSKCDILTNDLINNSVSVTQGETIYIYSENGDWPSMIYQKYGTSCTFGYAFTSTGKFKVSGKVTDLTNSELLCHMFDNCTSLVSAPELPATTLTDYCYFCMFRRCSSLVSAPELPATTLTNNCYSYMLIECTSLVNVPELLATTLANSCYERMFKGCTSLVSAPELPATTLADYCYAGMFRDCKSLVSAPELPATTLADYCYDSMFNSCTSLVSAPELPATTLTNNCYAGMFNGCSNLNHIKAMFTTTPSNTYTLHWVEGVSSTGTFVKSKDATWDVTGENGIPEGWTVETA